jgi:hypothetical protein
MNRINTKTELSFYGFSKPQISRPRWNAIANQVGVRPTSQRFANITDNSNKQSKVYKDFVRAVKTNLQQKYRTDNELVIQPWSMTYKRRFKNTPWDTITTAGVVQGKRTDILGLVANAIAERQQDIEQYSPTESKDFSEPTLGETQLVPVNGGKLVAKGIRVARMKAVGALKLDNNYSRDTSWDLKQDTCVYDYIFHKYAGKNDKKKLPIKNREKAYEYLDMVFTIANPDENIYLVNPRQEGVSVEQIKNFCIDCDITMIALDKNEKLIEYIKSKNRNKDALIFIVCNNHFYPIEDTTKRDSVVGKNKEADKPDEEKQNWKSDDFAFETKEGKELNFKVKYPQVGSVGGNEWAVNKIMELGVMPMPGKLRVDENQIISFVIDDTLYLTKRPSDNLLEYCGKNFSGQTSSFILSEFWREFDSGVKNDYSGDIEISNWFWGEEEEEEEEIVIEKPVPIKSVFNPEVWKPLMTEGVKYRTHYGATRDLSDLLKIIPAVKETYTEIVTTNYKDIFTGEVKSKSKTITRTGDNIIEEPKTIIQKLLETGEAISVDVNKCYSACLKNPYDNWLRYTTEDTWEDFTDNVFPLETGLYYVETDDLTLLHQTNIYSNKILDKAYILEIPFKITKKLIHKKVYENEVDIPKNYFEPLLKIIKNKTGGKGLMKELNNMISGCLGKTHQKNYTAELDEDPDAVWRHFLSCERPEIEDDFVKYFFKEGLDETGYTRFNKDNLVLNTLNGSGDKKLYLYGYEIRSSLNENTLPMYIQILDWSNMRLYDMGKEIGGEIIYRHTDCIVSLGGKFTEKNYYDWGDYKLEPPDKEQNWTSMMKTDRHIEVSEFKSYWKHNPEFISSSDWKNIINYAIDKGGLLISGQAGTGKSFIPKSAFQSGLLNLVDRVSVDEYGKETKTYADTKSMSFTNKASRNIMGTTIHKLLHITSAGTLPRKTMNSLKKYKYFVIDEIGMISNQLWDYLMLLKKTNPKAIFILLGDWRQLPPIEEGRIEDLDVFNHPIVKFLCNGNSIELTERQRYDIHLWNYLQRGQKNNDWSGIPEQQIKYEDIYVNNIYVNKSICYFNKTRVKINHICMEHFKEEVEHIYLEHKLEDIKDKRQSVYLYDGLPIMAWKNCVKLGIVNSEEFVVNNFDEEKIYITREEGGEDLEIEIDDFHNYFVPNYCATTHKSQGATYRDKVFLWDWNRLVSNKKIVYTATSRATKFENLVIATGLE